MTLKIPAQTKRALVALARKYESPEFTDDDPSHILRAYKSRADIECAAFVMSALSFGRREQFMRKAGEIFTLAGAHPALWLKSGGWSETFGRGPKKFYRFYSFDDMRGLFARLQEILSRSKSFGDAEREEHGRAVSMSAGARVELAWTIGGMFRGCRVVGQGKTSANKRVNMFLRWMVRKNSPVDLGLWTWHSSADLVIPMDTHVLQSAVRLGLLPQGSAATAKTARALTDALKQIWPDDPCKGDFALFGYGINGFK